MPLDVPLPTARRRRVGLAGGAAALVLVAGACGSAHHSVPQAVAPTSTTVPPTTVPPTTVAPVHLLPPSPLTDLPAASLPQLKAPAVVVKIDNVEGAFPQTGVNQADVVYEEMVEGGLTRLAAVYQSTYPPQVGPVRSGRLTDIAIVDDLDHPVLAFAGANGIFLPQLREQPIEDVDIDNHGEMFVRQGPHAAPHDLYTSPARDAALDEPSGPPSPLFDYRPASAPLGGAGATPATAVAMSWPSATVRWAWSAAAHVWDRTMNGTPDLDSTGRQLVATNLIIQPVPYPTVDRGLDAGVMTDLPEGILVGSGPVWVLSGGAVVQGTWHRASLSSPTTYTDGAGHTITLAPGTTWVELTVAGTTPTVS